MSDRPTLGSLVADPRTVVARRELRSLASEKTIVLALLIQLFIAAFSSFLVVGLVSLVDPAAAGGSITLAIAGNASGIVGPIADDRPGVRVLEVEQQTDALAAFDDGRADAAIEVTRQPPGLIDATVTVPDGSLQTARLVAQVRAIMEAVERDRRNSYAGSLDADLAPLPPSGGGSPYYGFTYTILLPLLVFIPVFISGSIGVDTIAEERERGTLDLLRAAPMDLGDVVTGKVATAVGIAPAQTACWIALLWINGQPVANVGALLALVTGLTMMLVAVGVGLALVLPDRRQSQFAYSTLVLVGIAAGLLSPEHPANVVARLAVGSPGPETVATTVVFVIAGIVAAFVLARLVRRHENVLLAG